MRPPDRTLGSEGLSALEAENRMLREEIRVSREAAEITAHLVVEQFEKTDAMLTRFQEASANLGKLNTELEAANQRLQQLDQMKSDFLSSVSHELRTPLTSIRGFSSLVDREFSRSFLPLAGDDDELRRKSQRIRDNLEIILKESERLTRLINDVLDLAKIEAGRVEWNDVPIRMETLIRDAARATQGMFEQKPEVALHLDIESGLPAFIGDADRMLQVLVNLISNAVKFTEQGAVTIKVFLNAEKLLQIEIHDTGIGFPSEEAESIFDKFQQAQHGDTLADRPKGTGLGLSICREIVGRHGGRVWARSKPGAGSVFSITLPVSTEGLPVVDSAPLMVPGGQACTAGLGNDQMLQGLGGRPKILVVDDDPGVRDYLTQLLQEQGWEVLAAENGHAAIAAAKQYRPDLITMDLAMPVMDGRTAIVNLRTDAELQNIPIMVISAIPGWESAGGDLAMPKPLDEARFLENSRLLLGGSEGLPSWKANFLVLHDGNEMPTAAPVRFTSACEVEFCALDELDTRLQAGFRGMVVVPLPLLGRVDLGMLNAASSLEVMIVPMPAGEKRTAGEFDV